MKHLHLMLVLWALAGEVTVLNAQPAQRTCSTNEYWQHLREQFPHIEQNRRLIERQTTAYQQQAHLRGDRIITIPVVVHVLYNTSTELISEEQILAQIEVLNADFRRYNENQTDAWPQAADTNIEFCLASTAPNGSPTTGIVYQFTSKPYFSFGDDMKYKSSGGSDAWPSTAYLNIWVCDLPKNYLGFAQFPGGPAETDGVVIDYTAFGKGGSAQSPFHLGRTCTHEVGHWLNLLHPWGDSYDCSKDDLVDDTPLTSRPYFGCRSFGASCGSIDMIPNFMGYSDDACLNLFTEGQKDRMHALFQDGGARASILESGGCGNGALNTCNNGIWNPGEKYTDCGGICPECEEERCAPPANPGLKYENNRLTVRWNEVEDAQSYVYEIRETSRNTWFVFQTTRRQINVAGFSANKEYESRLKTICRNGEESDYINLSTFATRIAGPVAIPASAFYPNPASRLLTINWATGDDPETIYLSPSSTNGKIRLRLFNLQGKEVKSLAVSTSEEITQIDVSDLGNGIYFISAVDPSGQLLRTGKIVVQR